MNILDTPKYGAAALGLFIMPAVLHAADTSASFNEHGLYGSVETGVASMAYPENRFFAIRGEASPFTRGADLNTDDGDARGLSITGKLGFNLNTSFAGSSNTSIELQASRTAADQTTTSSFTDGGAGVRYGWVILDNSSGFGTPDGATLTTNTQQDFVFWGADALLALKYKQADKASWTVLVGPSYKSLLQETDITGTISTVVNLSENLETDFTGIKIGVQYDRALNRDWSVSASFAASHYNTDIDYKASYSDSGLNTATADLDDSDHSLGLDAGLEFARRITDRVNLSAFATVNYLSDVPRVSYGSVPTDSAGGVLRLTDDNLTTWVIGLKLSGSF